MKIQKLSRFAVEQSLNCPRCFVLQYKHKISLPGLPFTLNSAVDNLCKNEFDAYFVSSADFSSITMIGFPDLTYGLYNFSISAIALSLLEPTTIRSGFKKSSTANPSLKNSGFDIISNSRWSSFDELKKSKLATCITKGHLFSQSKGITRIFGDFSYSDNGKDIESIGNTTIIPNSVVKKISKL